VLLAGAGLLGAVFVENPERAVRAEECPGGQIAGVARDAAGCAEAGASTGRGRQLAATGRA
jgi:hypothetical protein